MVPLIQGPADLTGVPALLQEYGGEFCASLRADPDMVAAVCRSGYLPMSEDFTGRELLLIKVHHARCLLDPADLRLEKSVRRRARGLEIRVDSSFERCLERIVVHHPDRWLSNRLCESFAALHRLPIGGVRLRSVEVYRGTELVAGEIGYTCGRAYTSLSGFHAESGAGAVQLACLGVLLGRAGFSFWDLGMEIAYKLRLGARLVQRERFLWLYRAAAAEPTPDLPDCASCEALVRPAPLT